ncbi:bacilysin biosynthesis protein BacA [Bacillus sp. 179-C3.3 HS]|uniref:bacilysin biosynthesis protein BacA n=1 Tax=Bacillus sp. 179-C3.3 HS TaxID=3232162 RepID=UPI0039A37772
MILKNDVFHFKEEPSTLPKMFTVNTLGPKGTSSEYAAKHFISHSTTTLGIHTKLSLYDSFEICIEHTLSNALQYTLVPHAYEGIKHFYMRPDLQLLQIFRCDTPMYGLAVRPDFPFQEHMLRHLKIVSHPAPVNLIQYFIHQNAEFELVNSTSTAAQKVRDGEFDIALTNEVARATYGLTFVQTFKSIPMSWSIFGKGEI